MKILHTADWHIGKTLRGRSRAEEHRAVFAEIAEIAKDQDVDAIFVAGDIFDAAAPTPEAEEIAYEAMLKLAAIAQVVMIAGNHDNPHRLRAVAPVLSHIRIHTGAYLKRPEEGGIQSLEGRHGERAKIALVPFISQRQALSADEVMENEASKNVQDYESKCKGILDILCKGMDSSSINLAIAHLSVNGGKLGGGERPAHTADEYYVSPLIFPKSLQYVALGHLHAPQRISGASHIWYSGAPLQLDFGEGNVKNSVLVVDVEPRQPAKVETIPLSSGKALKTLRGSFSELAKEAEQTFNCYVRAIVDHPAEVGLAERVRQLFAEPEDVVDVIVESTQAETQKRAEIPADLSEVELFRLYLRENGKEDEELVGAFRQIAEEPVATY